MSEVSARLVDPLGLHAPTYRELNLALRAVLDLHRPVFYETNLCMTCVHCRDGQPFPCATVEAIAETLDTAQLVVKETDV